jgi:hypothetical protein
MAKKVVYILFILSLIFLYSCDDDSSENDQTGAVSGTVYATGASTQSGHPKAGTPIEGATVAILDTDYSTYTDSNGQYNLTDIQTGSYTVKAYAVGYQEETEEVEITEGAVTDQDFYLNPSSAGNTYYVAVNGDDSNPGTQDNPWKSPAYGAGRLQPGDTLIIKRGTYSISNFEDAISIPSGAAGNWITIKGESGSRPKIECSNNLYAAIDIGNASYIRIENIEICAASGKVLRDGIIGTDGEMIGVVLKDLYVHNLNEFGVNLADVRDMQIIDCSIEYCGFGAVGGPAGNSGGWRNVKIKGCSLSYGGHHYVGGDNPYDRPDGFGIEPSNGPIEICDCIAEHNMGDGLDSKAKNTYIHHCIVANNSCDGVKLWGAGSTIENTLIYGTGDGDASPSPWAGIVIGTSHNNATFKIINVTLHENHQRQGYPIYVQYDESAPITVIMKNTIIANSYGHAYFGDSVSLTANYNIFYMPTRSDQVYANGREYTKDELNLLGTSNLYADPMFVQPTWGSTGNYKLKESSSAIDAGTSSGAPTDDLEHTSRPQGDGYDKGAYEQ